MNFRQMTLDEAVTSTFEAEPQPPFSKIIIEQARKDQLVRHCPTCHHEERIYRRTLRPCFLPALRVLIEHGPMTTTELFKHFEDRPGLAAAIARHFSEVRHWRFAQQLENGKWYPTLRAQQFLAGEIQVFAHVWPREHELPPECVDEKLVYVYQVERQDWSNKAKHVKFSTTPV